MKYFATCTLFGTSVYIRTSIAYCVKRDCLWLQLPLACFLLFTCSGFIAERTPLRYFLVLGMLGELCTVSRCVRTYVHCMVGMLCELSLECGERTSRAAYCVKACDVVLLCISHTYVHTYIHTIHTYIQCTYYAIIMVR